MHVSAHTWQSLRLEVAKNICLAGPKSVTIHDCQPASVADLSGNFYMDRSLQVDAHGLFVPEASRAQLTHPQLTLLNPNCGVRLHDEPAEDAAAIDALIDGHEVVICTDLIQSRAVLFNERCRAKNIYFVAADVRGVSATSYAARLWQRSCARC